MLVPQSLLHLRYHRTLVGVKGTIITDKLSWLPFSYAVFIIHSANEVEDKHDNDIFESSLLWKCEFH